MAPWIADAPTKMLMCAQKFMPLVLKPAQLLVQHLCFGNTVFTSSLCLLG